jgi:glycosyltransferase involved in cell wall biosynthesis
MKILYLAYSSLASPTGGGRTRIVDAAKSTQSHGHKVDILCFVRPEQWLTPKFPLEGKNRLERDSGCRVFYLPRLPFTRFPWIYRLNVFYCTLVVWLYLLANKIRVIHGHGIFPSLIGIQAKGFLPRLKVVGDIHGLSFEESVYSGELDLDGKLAAILRDQETKVAQQADRLIFVSNKMKTHLEKKYQTRFANAIIIPSATNISFTLDSERRKSVRKEYGLENKIVFVYVGSAAPYQLVSEMCHLFDGIHKRIPESFFLIISHHQVQFEQQLQEKKIAPESYLMVSLEHNKVFDVLVGCDIGFLLRDDSWVNTVASPTKFAEYALCGIPMITTAFVGDISNIVQRRDLGLVIDLKTIWTDNTLIDFVRTVQNDRPGYARRCRAFVEEEFSWEIHGVRLNELYSSVVLSQ